MERPAGEPPIDKDAILEAVAPVIEKIAYYMTTKRQTSPGYDRFDLIQEGMLTAYFAIDRFDPSRGLELDKFLALSARGAMKRYIRDRGAVIKVPRTIFELGSKLLRELDLGDRKGSYERFDEMVEKYGVSRKVMKETYEHIFLRMMPMSFDMKTSDDEKTGLYDFYYEESYDIEHADRIRYVRERLERFSERDQSIFLTALSGLTQKEVAKLHDISQMHVSRIVRKVQGALLEANQQYDKDGDAI